MLMVFTKTTISVKLFVILLVVELILTCTVHPHDQHWEQNVTLAFKFRGQSQS